MWTIDRLEGDLAVLEVEEGKTVTVPKTALPEGTQEGDVLCIIEAMKLMNEIESDFDGKVAELYVENGQAVEYGQPLFRIA